MPTYTSECPCGKRYDYYSSIADRNIPRASRCCGLVMHRVLTPVNFNKPFQPYQCPITDKPINSIMQHEDNLKRHGCHVLEKGEREDAERVRRQADEALENKLAETAAQIVHDLPQETKDALAADLNAHEIIIQRS